MVEVEGKYIKIHRGFMSYSRIEKSIAGLLRGCGPSSHAILN
jgi:hypothetical protein